jgi:hypothetical protein
MWSYNLKKKTVKIENNYCYFVHCFFEGLHKLQASEDNKVLREIFGPKRIKI